MSILIKGMEMPTRCGECPCAYSTEGAYWDTCQAVDDQNDIEQFWKSGRPDWCPLVEVPIPHGRLIEAERLMHKLIRYGGISSWSEEELYYTIKDMDTIIEAEE